MSFAEHLKRIRKEKKLGQKQLAELSGISLRTLQNWESGQRRPSSRDAVAKLAQALGVPATVLLENAERFVIEAEEKGGKQAARDVETLVEELAGLFAGGELNDEEKDGVMAALNEAYWMSKGINKKYAPNAKKK